MCASVRALIVASKIDNALMFLSWFVQASIASRIFQLSVCSSAFALTAAAGGLTQLCSSECGMSVPVTTESRDSYWPCIGTR